MTSSLVVQAAAAKNIQFKNGTPSASLLGKVRRQLKALGIRYGRPNRTAMARLNAKSVAHVSTWFDRVADLRREMPQLTTADGRWVFMDETPLHAKFAVRNGKVFYNPKLEEG